jgi:hypothetical protein
MPKQHVARDGECISSIAFQYGFFADTIWNDPANAELRSQRENMNILAPGDVVTIPDKRLKEETRPTGNTHRFQRKGVPAKLRLRIEDHGEPLKNQPYTLTVDQQKFTGMTNDEGDVVVSIPPNAKRGHLVVGQGDEQREYHLQLGHLHPIDRIEGVQARLVNLGYDCGGEEGTIGPNTTAALKAFQKAQGLPETGELDDATRAKIKEVHDGQ